MAERKPVARAVSRDLGCLDCPFYVALDEGCHECEDLYCYHPKWQRRVVPMRRIERAKDMRKPRMRPTWCPLETQPVLVSLEVRR